MNIVVMGAQWGDEGKGKIVDYLAQDAKYVCRFSGGSNAGHSIVTGGKRYALHQVPSGILYNDKQVFLGSGMVVDPVALFEELKMLSDGGIDWKDRVWISDRAHIVLPCYKQMDKDRDAARKHPIGTTGRGIGIAYSEKAQRDGIRLCDMDWSDKIRDLSDTDKAFVEEWRAKLFPMKVDIAAKMWELRNENILFEAAQGAMLDLDSGTYPFVTSGASGSYGASSGAGIGPKSIDKVFAVFKAYETRVGNGPMPSEFNNTNEKDLCDYVRKTGNEFGVTTGRPRRCGYLDLVALRYACRVNSIGELCLTHLDVYDAMDNVDVCVAYNIGGKETTDFPSSIPELMAAKPVLKKFDGWRTSIVNAPTYEDLPAKARDYISFVEEYTKTHVGIVSLGADRKQTLVRCNVWK